MKNIIGCVIFDWKRTLYDSEKMMLLSNVKKVLLFFQNLNIDIHLIGKGGGEMYQEVKRLGISNQFCLWKIRKQKLIF